MAGGFVIEAPKEGRRSSLPPSVLVLGDLVLDVVIAAATDLAAATDVPGRVALRQGGSAATTARWLARLGARSTLVCAVGRDAFGRALVRVLDAEGVVVRASHVAGQRTGRIGVVVTAGGERSFVADRGAADMLAPEDLDAAWFERIDHLHLPAYSLLGQPLGLAGQHAIDLARRAGASVSVDLASVRPLLAGGRNAALALLRSSSPDVLLATDAEADALVGRRGPDVLVELAPTVVLKRGAAGATVLGRQDARTLRFDIATRPLSVADSTGAGDAFDAGFLLAWLEMRAAGAPMAGVLRRAVVAGHRAAARQLVAPRMELRIR